MFKKRSKPAQDLARVRQASPEAAGSDVVDDGSRTSTTVADLLALRKLKQAELSSAGIDATKLNAGVKRKQPEPATPTEDNLKTAIEILAAEGSEDDPNSISKKLARNSNFTQQTNMVDVDKHMMAFIEEELRKKRVEEAAAKGIALVDRDGQKPLNQSELYKIADKYNVLKKPGSEGNVTLSSAMLTSIPEVDLGIDVRIRNIEETERAKRALFEKEQAEANKQVTAAELEAESFARERFWRPSLPAAGQSALAVQLQSDKELLKLAKEAAARGEIDEWDVVPAVNGGTRRQKASDDQVVQRYRERAKKNSQSHQKGIYWNR